MHFNLGFLTVRVEPKPSGDACIPTVLKAAHCPTSRRVSAEPHGDSQEGLETGPSRGGGVGLPAAETHCRREPALLRPRRAQEAASNCSKLSLPSGDGEYGRQDPVESRRPTVCAVSAGAGEQEPGRGKPIGLVLDLRTTADLRRKKRLLPRWQVLGLQLYLLSFFLKTPSHRPWSGCFTNTEGSHVQHTRDVHKCREGSPRSQLPSVPAPLGPACRFPLLAVAHVSFQKPSLHGHTHANRMYSLILTPF